MPALLRALLGVSRITPQAVNPVTVAIVNVKIRGVLS